MHKKYVEMIHNDSFTTIIAEKYTIHTMYITMELVIHIFVFLRAGFGLHSEPAVPIYSPLGARSYMVRTLCLASDLSNLSNLMEHTRCTVVAAAQRYAR